MFKKNETITTTKKSSITLNLGFYKYSSSSKKKIEIKEKNDKKENIFFKKFLPTFTLTILKITPQIISLLGALLK